ncbi:hypothetical protein QM012_007937 [Aureobasidium pullulans]|uniref:Zn(2)-C6 fungal-type domain-containing protein n=1 Tax=Aureobasidium pullulans TaxID=5580 RepID=A0ABR0TL32_AURPU
MEPSNSKPMPSGGGNVAAAFRVKSSGKGRHYRDHDFVLIRDSSLDYNESDLEPPYTPTKRKRTADVDQSRQHSCKKPRNSKDDRSDRLCLQCGNYHSSPCYVPYCSSCDLNHYPGVPCLNAMEQLKERLELHAPPGTPPSSKQKNKKNMIAPASLPLHFRDENHASSALSYPQAPSSLLESVSQSPINKQHKQSPRKRPCPLCRECGRFHRSACKYPICEQCKNKHHSETPCVIAEPRLKRRLEEEDARQAQTMEEIKQAEKSIVAMNKEMSSVALQFTRSSPLTPRVATRNLKKNTRFCRDCGRYLNRPCTWPTCKKCNTKHFEHVTCWQARQNLRKCLDTFDRGYDISQKKKIARVKAMPPASETSSQQSEHVTTSDEAHSAAAVDLAVPSGMIVDFEDDREMSWSLGLIKTIHLGLPPTDFHLPKFTTPESPKHHSHVHLSDRSINSEPDETAEFISQSMTNTASDGSMVPSDSTRKEVPRFVTRGATIEENVDAFIADVLREMHDNDNIGDASGHGDVPQDVPSYLDYLRRNGS